MTGCDTSAGGRFALDIGWTAGSRAGFSFQGTDDDSVRFLRVGEGSSGSSVEFFESSLQVEVGCFHRCGRRRREW